MSDPYLTLCPVGTVVDFAGPEAKAPSGWLACDGKPYPRADYPELFAAIGTTWGAGDGSATFNVPDLRGRVAVGAGKGEGLTERTLGQRDIGSESVKLTAAQSGLPAHTHTQAAHSHTITTNHANDKVKSGTNYARLAGGGSVHYTNHASANSQQPAIYANAAADASSAHENMQPSAVLVKIIRAKSVSDKA